jgi:hypothetical protein
MRGLIDELEGYYSGRSSQECEPSPPRPSVDAGTGHIARGGEESSGPSLHILICLFGISGVEAQPAHLTNPEKALGLCRADHGSTKNALPTLDRPSMIPRLQHPKVNAVKTSTIASARTSITGPQLHPSRQGLGPRSFSNPSFPSKPDVPPIISHGRSWSLKSLIPRRAVTVKPNDSAVVRFFINQW